jgi:hypothetical protein
LKERVFETVLSNGLKVILLEDHKVPLVTFQVWYRVGSRDERVGLTGLSHYLEHMMFKGTPTYGPRIFSKLIETAGGQDNAFTSRDVTAYHVTIAADQLDLMADRMRHLPRPRRWRPKRVVMEERRTRTDEPIEARGLFGLSVFCCPRLPTVGFAQDIEQLSATDLGSGTTPSTGRTTPSWWPSGFSGDELLAKIRHNGSAFRAPICRRWPWSSRAAKRPLVAAQLPVVFQAARPEPPLGGRPPSVLSTVLSGGRASLTPPSAGTRSVWPEAEETIRRAPSP